MLPNLLNFHILNQKTKVNSHQHSFSCEWQKSSEVKRKGGIYWFMHTIEELEHYGICSSRCLPLSVYSFLRVRTRAHPQFQIYIVMVE